MNDSSFSEATFWKGNASSFRRYPSINRQISMTIKLGGHKVHPFCMLFKFVKALTVGYR